MAGIVEKTKQGIVLRVRIAPNSSSCSIGGIQISPDGDEYLKISVHSVPEKGKANKELVAFLAKLLRLAKSKFRIISGETDRNKKILLETTAEVQEIVQALGVKTDD